LYCPPNSIKKMVINQGLKRNLSPFFTSLFWFPPCTHHKKYRDGVI